MPTKPKPHEDHDGMVETRSAIILIHLQDEMMQIQAKNAMEKSYSADLKRRELAKGKSLFISYLIPKNFLF
jgi:hypothetical protein